MQRGLIIIGAVFAASLGLAIGFRLSQDALAIIVGVVLGLLASLPLTIGVIYVLIRYLNRHERQQPMHQPSVVVVAPPGASTPAPAPTLPVPARRTFTIIGDEGTD